MAEHSFMQSSFPVGLPEYKSAQSIFDHMEQEATKESRSDGITKRSAFMEAMKRATPTVFEDATKTYTTNGDGTYSDAGEPLVNLFAELEDAVSGSSLQALLEDAWHADADLTLKIIWNSRSIHLGKSSRRVFYRAVGWLYETHPMTLLENLPWLVRPVIRKKAPKPVDGSKEAAAMIDKMDLEDEDSDFEIIDAKRDADDSPAKRARVEEPFALGEFDVKYGVAHGYWKDLLNILTLASHDKLTVFVDVREVFNTKPELKKYKRSWSPSRKKEHIETRHKQIVKKIRCDHRYAALSMRVAQLFADQLRLDVERLRSGTAGDLKKITFAGKYAPSNKGSHDRHTFIASTIAEILFPQATLCPEVTERSVYLRQARVAYQSQILSPLRKHLDVVERHISDGSFQAIKYERLPSLAMKQYTTLFAKNDSEHFTDYVNKVALGQAQISGAVLQPATMVAEARAGVRYTSITRGTPAVNSTVLAQIADGQWKSLVQRVKDSGSLESSIAVCDVSGSMFYPTRPDNTTPVDASIGMSLLLAEVCKAPFGGGIITFHEDPQFVWLKGLSTFQEKFEHIQRASWGGTTNFVAVFKNLILPHAKKHKVKQEDMVKRVFVFSDMQFNQAQYGSQWSTSFEEIKKLYNKAGYEMPELVFWNLAASHAAGRQSKPVQAEEQGTALISGYSQGMMKVFMDGAGFTDVEEPEMKDVVVIDEAGKEVKTKVTMTPYQTVLRAMSHEAYRMLKVVD